MENDPMGLGPEDQPDPEGDPPLTMTPDDFLPMLNIAKNAQMASQTVGMPYSESLLIMIATYEVLLRGALGFPLP